MMLGANTTISVARLITDAYSQKVYGGSHYSCEAYIEPASAEVILASGGPVGQLFSIFTDSANVPEAFQISDLVTDGNGLKYILTGIQEWENHLQMTCTKYESPSFTA